MVLSLMSVTLEHNLTDSPSQDEVTPVPRQVESKEIKLSLEEWSWPQGDRVCLITHASHPILFIQFKPSRMESLIFLFQVGSH